ncbi:MAG: hypothetical protein R6V10_13730 [bacterium]
MIRQYAGVLLLAGIMVVIQTTLVPELSGVLFIDFIFVMVVLVGMFKDPVHGAIMAFLLGGFQDIMSGQIVGLFMTSRLLVFLAAQFLRSRVSLEKPAPQFAMGTGLGLADRLAIFVLCGIFSEPLSLTGSEFAFMAGGVLINAALVPVFYQLFRLLPGFYEPKRGPVVRR